MRKSVLRWPAAALAVMTALSAAPALAQSASVRDCRDDAVVLPVVPRGHDLVVVHATDDLAGPSIFDRYARLPGDEALKIEVRAFPTYAAQLDAYLSCETPFMRVTHAMMSQIGDVTEGDERTRMEPIFFYGWSNGADALVGRGQSSVSDLAGATLFTDLPRLDFALQLAGEASPRPQVQVVDDPRAAFAADAGSYAVMSSADAAVVTAGSVGTGAEGSIKGARSVLTTTSASRVNGDLLVARADFVAANPTVVEATVRALLKAEELFREDAKKQIVDYELAADILLGDGSRAPDLKTMWAGVETVGLSGQVDWATPSAPRGYRAIVNQGQTAMVAAGLLDEALALAGPSLDYTLLGDDIWDKRRTSAAQFDQDAATAAIKAMSSDEIDGSTIASVTVLFESNQATFPVQEYGAAFEEALLKAQVYAGAVLSIEAHSSYNGYLRGVIKDGWTEPRQKRELASLRNTSTQRALAVQRALVDTAGKLGMAIDESQITINGRGISDPLGGFCEGLPCPPKTAEEWRASRRVIFRVIAMESEDDVFQPLNTW